MKRALPPAIFTVAFVLFIGFFALPSQDIPSEPEVLVGAGDISMADSDGDEQTAHLLDRVVAQYPHAVIFTAGDTVQSGGRAADYQQLFHPTWGRYQERIRPVPGNHDYLISQGVPYFDYFGAAAGEPGKGYYSYDLGAWHIAALNSNCDIIDCRPESAQAQWLRDDLRRSQERGQTCTLLYWHHSPWTRDGQDGDSASLTFYNIASQYGVDVVVTAHHHAYERFAPQDGQQRPRRDGIRLFVVGSGGAGHHEAGDPRPNSEVFNNDTFGIIQFKLYPNRYDWQFLPEDDGTFTDAGSGRCH